MTANAEINWSALTYGITGGSKGVFLVQNGTAFLPATTSNFNTYQNVFGILREDPVYVDGAGNGVAQVQFGGPVGRDITGLPASGNGFAVLDLTTGRATYSATLPGNMNLLLGKFNDGVMLLATNQVVQTVASELSVLDYGAIGNGIADDTAAIQAAIDDMDIGDVLNFPWVSTNGTYRITSALSLEGKTGITLRGTSAPSLGINYVRIECQIPRRETTVATVASKTNGVAAYYQVLTGLTGLNLTSADRGKRLKVSGAATANLNGIAPITQVISSTSCVIQTNANTATDANNGAITCLLLERMINMRGRENAVEGLALVCYGASFYAWVGFELTRSAKAGAAYDRESSNCRITNCMVSTESIGPRTCLENGVEIGCTIVPEVGSSLYAFDGASGQPTPISPNNCDVHRIEESKFTVLNNAAILSMNTSGQSRLHKFVRNQALDIPYGVYIQQPWASFYQPCSMSFDSDNFAMDQISECMYWLGVGQAPVNIFYPISEDHKRFVAIFQSTTSPAAVNVWGGYLMPVGNSLMAADGEWCKINNGILNLYGVACFGAQMTGQPFQITAYGTRVAVNAFGCDFPDPAVTGVATFANPGGVTEYCAQEWGCTDWNEGTATRTFRANRTWTFGTATTRHNKIRGTITIADANTSADFTFPTPEGDTTYSVAAPMITAITGAPAAGAYVQRACTKATDKVTYNVSAAPGAGTSVTFDVCIYRD